MTNNPAQRHQEAAAAAAAALLGTIIGGPAGGVVGAAVSPLLVPFAEQVWAELKPAAQARGGAVLGVAAHERGIDAQQLLEEILASDEARQLLAGLVINAAAQTANHDKIRGLGRALANGLTEDDAVVDEQLIIVRALDDMEAPHLAVLDMMATTHLWAGSEPTPLVDGQAPMPWREVELRRARPGAEMVLPTILGTLERHGLVLREDNLPKVLEEYSKTAQKHAKQAASRGSKTPMPTLSSSQLRELEGKRAFRVTPLGVRLLQYVRIAGLEPPGDQDDAQQPQPSED